MRVRPPGGRGAGVINIIAKPPRGVFWDNKYIVKNLQNIWVPWARHRILNFPVAPSSAAREVIEFSLAKPQNASVKVFDVRGRLVRTLVHRTQTTEAGQGPNQRGIEVPMDRNRGAGSLPIRLYARSSVLHVPYIFFWGGGVRLTEGWFSPETALGFCP